MINLFIVVSLLALFAWYQVLISLLCVLHPGKSFREISRPYTLRAIQAIFRLLRAYSGFRIHVERSPGVELPERFLLLANHQSLLDIPIVMSILLDDRQPRFIAKRELGRGIPLISLILRRQGHCLVRRSGDPMAAMRQVTEFALRCAEEGTCPVVFPEGTRSRTGELGTFHSAGVRKVLEVGSLPVVVLTLEGGWKTATLKNFLRFFGTEPYRVRFEAVLPPPQGKRETLEALQKARDLIESSLIQMRVSAGH